jgi:GDP-D-mannose dehydratase
MAKRAIVTGITGQDGSYVVRAKTLSVSLSNAYFKSLGLPTLIDGYQRN